MTLFSKTGQESGYIAWWLERQKNRKDAALRFAELPFDVRVRRTAFSPDPSETHSSSLFLNHLPKLSGKRFLDMGGGCGVLGLLSASQQAASTIVIDIDTEAVANTLENFEQNGLLNTAKIYRGDLFERLTGTFDVIAANLPIVDEAWPRIEETPNNLYARFMNALPSFLSPGGACYLSFASFGDIDGFEMLLRKQALSYDITTEQLFNVNWYLLKLFHRS